MTEFRRPALAGANITQLSEHLSSAGIGSTIRQELGDAAYITTTVTAAALDAALAGFVNDANWRPPLRGDLPTHAAHIAAIRNATPAQLAAMTDAQLRHALQDVCKALALFLDDRLGT